MTEITTTLADWLRDGRRLVAENPDLETVRLTDKSPFVMDGAAGNALFALGLDQQELSSPDALPCAIWDGLVGQKMRIYDSIQQAEGDLSWVLIEMAKRGVP